ncbi:MAG TPA: c-type cytochrome domain-containing protein [Kofleriaceae bacterium]|jgi:hypothetical protein|nr:c-type cytochrome domain-containing protein [Kofleriaceae bacterium]
MKWTWLLFALAACTDVDERPANWGYLHAAVIVPSCATASCHSDEAAVAGVKLDDADTAYELLLSDRYVIAGDAASPLLQLLRANERDRMPPDAPLPLADIELVEAWITGGAPR